MPDNDHYADKHHNKELTRCWEGTTAYGNNLFLGKRSSYGESWDDGSKLPTSIAREVVRL